MSKKMIRLLQPRQLEAATAVARTGSVHAAARDLGIPQPAVSRLIATTEHTLGVTLFDRSQRGMQPTNAGARVLGHIAFALDALRQVGQAASEPEPVIRLGCVPRVTHVLLPHLLALLGNHDAGFRLHISVGTSEELLADLKGTRLDFIVALRAVADAEALPLEAEELYKERTVVVCGRDNPDVPETTGSLSQLAQLPWVLPKKGFHSRDLIDRLMASTNRPPIVPIIETNSFETSLSVVAATRFMAIAPEFAARRFERLRMVRIVPTRPAFGSSQVLLQYARVQREHPTFATFRRAIAQAVRQVDKA